MRDVACPQSRTLGDLLDEMAARQPEREFIVGGETRLTYAEARTRVRRLAKGLYQLGVRRGDNVALARLGPGDWVGEMSLLLDEPRSATVVAATDAQLRRITRHDLAHVLAEDPKRTEELLRQLARRVKATNERVAGRA